MNEEAQYTLDLEEVDDRLYFEDTTLTADVVLAQAIGKYDKVFLIGVDNGSVGYFSNDCNGMYWNLALDRAKEFLMRIM